MHLSRDLKVLLVDDDADLLDSMKDLFKLFGFSVITASDGENAWEQLQKEKVDIVLTDVRMAPMDGFDLLKRIKDHDIQNPKVVISTAFSDYSISEFFAEGADAFFLKPFDASTIRDCLWQSVMSLNERWQVPPKADTTSSLKAEFESTEAASLAGDFSLGRLGFFFSQEANQGPMPEPDQWVHFDFQFANEPSLPHLKGVGRVKWTRDEVSGSEKCGMGVEIRYLDPESIKNSISYINGKNMRPSIPNR